ncbi:MAG: IS110 family transposase [Desulfobacterales bacterium]|jgi:transposase
MKPFYMGIDVSKGYADFMIIDAQKKPVIQGFQLDDTFVGHQALYNIVGRFLSKHSDSMLFVGMESTGGYENNWYNSLVAFQGSLGIQTARLNPLGVKRNSQADLKKNTTDKISAQNIAEYLVAHPEKVTYQQQDQLVGLRKQWGFIQTLTKQRTQFLNQFKGLLYTSNPELLRYCQTETPAWILKLVVKYPSAAKLKRAKVKTVAKIPYLPKTKAQQVVADAKRSVASATDMATEQLVVATAQQIIHLNKTIDGQTRRMIEVCAVPEVELLKTFSGINDKSAIGLIIEIQTVERFENAKKLASFFGVHPVYKISGDGVGGIKMSKQGRKEPRHILYMVTLSALNCNPLIKKIYEKHQKNGKHNMAAMGICMHKILRIIYGMLKHNKPFDPRIDIANRRRGMQARKASPKRNPSRRFQAYDTKAPVSRRQKKKRLERDRSHSVPDTKSGITAPVPVGDTIANILPEL